MRILNSYILFLSFFSVSLMAQDGDQIVVRAKVKDDQIVLRWAPSNAELWVKGSTYGYIIEKLDLTDHKYDPTKFARVNQKPILPWSREDFKEFSDHLNTFIVGAATALYPRQDYDRRHILDSLVRAREEVENRFGLALRVADLNAYAAQSLGLRFEIPLSRLEKKVAFRISIANAKLSIDPVIIMVDFKGKPNDVRPEIEEIIEMERAVKIKWDRDLHVPYFTAYHIERSRDAVDWVRFNAVPFLPGRSEREELSRPSISFIDSIPNFQPYYYRMVGIDLFGDESAASLVVKAQARDLTPPGAASLDTVREISNGALAIEWSYLSQAGDFAGFNVTRGRKIDGIFTRLNEELLGSSVGTWIDHNASEHEANLYRIETLDTSGNRSLSNIIDGILRDTVAPAAPMNLVAEVDEQGVVDIQWQNNIEPDLFGYLIYFSNDSSEQFISLNGIPQTENSYRDTINLNSRLKDIYYSVRAVDNLRHHSDFSKWVSVQRPDTIPPAVPLITSIEKISDEHVRVKWKSNTDLDYYILFTEVDGKVSHVDTIGRSIFQYEAEMKPNKNLTFRLLAVDQSGLISTSQRTQVIKHSVVMDPVDLMATFDANEKKVNLNWITGDATRVTLYRSYESMPWVTVQTFNGDQDTYQDQKIVINNIYKYRLKSIDVDRNVLWSDVVEVEIK